MKRKFIRIFLLLLMVILTPGYSDVRIIKTEKTYTENAQFIEEYLKKNAGYSNIMRFTKVPRGLIVSVDERYLFNRGSTKIKLSGTQILDDFLVILQRTKTRCVIEGHTENNNFDGKPYEYDWELSLLRAGNITKYFIKYGGIAPNRLFTLGFGEYMPSVDNVDKKLHINNRIDFVFLDYAKNTRQ